MSSINRDGECGRENHIKSFLTTEYTELKGFTKNLLYRHAQYDCTMGTCGVDGSPIDATRTLIELFGIAGV